MNTEATLRKSLVFLALGLMVATSWLAGCNSSSVTPDLTRSYEISSALVQDPNRDSTYVVVDFLRRDTLLPTAQIIFDGMPLIYRDRALVPHQFPVDSVFWLGLDSAERFAGGSFYLTLQDNTDYRDSLVVAVVDTSSIQTLAPSNHLVRANDVVSLTWRPAANAETYILAAVKADEAYTGTGFSDYAATGLTAGTIPADAFLLPGSSDPDTGLYNVYVYAVNGSPDSLLSHQILPVPLPGQLPANIERSDLIGRTGSITVTGMDTVRVVQIP
ncbi:MAG: hypothetical protein KKA42_09715 [candidate division Zixibacteria bacterium]|nr:hypothetical protein [candidate division Zixibacteria bacterium]